MIARRPKAKPWPPLLAAMWEQRQKMELKNHPAGMMATRLHSTPSVQSAWRTGLAGRARTRYLCMRAFQPPGWRQLQNLLQQVFHPVSISSSMGSPRWGPPRRTHGPTCQPCELRKCTRLKSCCKKRKNGKEWIDTRKSNCIMYHNYIQCTDKP